MSVIETRNLIKRYGPITALNDVTLRVEKGEIFGLLGQNGAGKTTLVKLLLGLVRATDGEALLLEEPIGTMSVCRQIVEQHQGRIRVESKVGKGSTFTVKLPLHAEQVVASR